MTDAGTTHPLVADYLDRLRREARRLPDDQARELVADITEHLEVGLAPTPGAETSEAEVRNALDRLGSPSELVDAAGGTSPTSVPIPPPARSRGVEIGAIVTLVGAELLFILLPIAALLWLVGVVLLVVSHSWTARQKLRGFLSLATGFPLVLVVLGVGVASTVSGPETCTSEAVPVGQDPSTVDVVCTSASSGPPAWVGIAVLVALGLYLVWQVLTVRALLRAQATKSSQLSAR